MGCANLESAVANELTGVAALVRIDDVAALSIQTIASDEAARMGSATLYAWIFLPLPTLLPLLNRMLP